MRSQKPPSVPAGAAMLLVVLFAFPVRLPAADEKTKEEKQTFGVYADPKGFANAEEMFRRPAVARAARTSDKLAELSVVLATRRLPETDDSTMAILRSIGGLTDEEYSRLRQLAMDAGRRIPRSKSMPAKAADCLAAGNRLYEKGELANAIKQYAAALRIAPDSLDARNNLALAEMHLGYDVSAAFHFRLMQALDPKYSGARTNLAVALARLGLSQEAYLTSLFAARDIPKSPIAQYNLAWFHNARGDYAGAAKSIALAFETLRTYDKALHLQALNEIEAGRTPPSESVAAVPKKERTRLGSIQVAAVFAPAGAMLRDRDRVAGTTRASQQFVVSDRQDPWIAVYWPDEVLKHRYWLHAGDVNAGVAAALTGVWRFKRDGKPWATARFQQENGAIRGRVEKNQADKLLHFNVDSVALDAGNVKMKIRYQGSGERATVKLTLGSNLRSMTGEAESPSGGSTVVVAEKTP